MTEKWIRDTGLVFASLFLILGFNGNQVFLGLSIFFLLSLLFYPNALVPVAFLWKKIAEVLGFVMNKVFFGVVFFGVITPIAYIRRIFYGDERRLSHTNKDSTAFVDCGGIVKGMDIEKPY